MRVVFTSHAEQRMKARNIQKEKVLETLNKPDKTVKRLGKHYFRKKFPKGVIEAVCEKTGGYFKVITVYWD